MKFAKKGDKSTVIYNKNITIEIAERVFCLHNRMAGAELFGLPDRRIRCHNAGNHIIVDDDNRPFNPSCINAIEQGLDHWFAGQRVQHLRQMRLHARAETGGKNDSSGWK